MISTATSPPAVGPNDVAWLRLAPQVKPIMKRCEYLSIKNQAFLMLEYSQFYTYVIS